MKKNTYKNINEEINRIKQMFNDQRLYGNIINEAGVPKSLSSFFEEIKSLFKIIDTSKNDNIITKTITNLPSITITNLSQIKILLDNFLNKYKSYDFSEYKDPNEVLNFLCSTNPDSICKELNDDFEKIIKSINAKASSTINKKGKETIINPKISKESLTELEKYQNTIIKNFVDANTSLHNVIHEKLKESINAGYIDEKLKVLLDDIYDGLGSKMNSLVNPSIKRAKSGIVVWVDKVKKIFNKIFELFSKTLKYSNILKNTLNMLRKQFKSIDDFALYMKNNAYFTTNIAKIAIFVINYWGIKYFIENYIYCPLFHRIEYTDNKSSDNNNLEKEKSNKYVSEDYEDVVRILKIFKNLFIKIFGFKFDCILENKENGDETFLNKMTNGFIEFFRSNGLNLDEEDEKVLKTKVDTVINNNPQLKNMEKFIKDSSNVLNTTINTAIDSITTLSKGLSDEDKERLYQTGI